MALKTKTIKDKNAGAKLSEKRDGKNTARHEIAEQVHKKRENSTARSQTKKGLLKKKDRKINTSHQPSTTKIHEEWEILCNNHKILKEITKPFTE